MATAQLQPTFELTPGWKWLRSSRYDITLILGTTLLAAAAGIAVWWDSALFAPILFADIMILGYHHVGSTFTRIAFDSESLSKYRAFLTWIPLAIAAVVGLLAYAIGLWFIVTVYFYWQWFHYSRQSYGISQAFYRKSGLAETENPILRQLTFYAIPVWGILSRSAEGPTHFLGSKMWAIPVPMMLVKVVGFAAACLVGAWIVKAVRDLMRSRAAVPHVAYMATHLSLFYAAYLGMKSLEQGWLVINIWHNAQYILFVWLFNANRFRNGVDPQHPFLSRLSQPRNIIWYTAFCAGLSLAFYFLINRALVLLPLVIAPSAALVYQMINIHHYIVDGVVWKKKKSAAAAAAVA